MNLLAFLKHSNIAIDESSLKIHLACWNGYEHPLDLFLDEEDKFWRWQARQNRKNFECKQLLSLIDLGNKYWLFAGVHQVIGCSNHPDHPAEYLYTTKLVEGQKNLIGRLITLYQRSRASYIWYKEGVHLPVVELRRERMVIEDFCGFNKVVLPYDRMKTIILQKVPSWHGALSNVKGIYLITDTLTGLQYVGKASGSSGIWQRWSDYVNTGHGGNIELRKLLKEKGSDYVRNFQYSILEIADTNASEQDILNRESHWMNVLGSRAHGLNG